MVSQASRPWPDDGARGNLCALAGVVGAPPRRSPRTPPYLKVTLVMGADAKFGAHVARCVKRGWATPLVANTAYADKWGYALRYYVDEEVMRRGSYTSTIGGQIMCTLAGVKFLGLLQGLLLAVLYLLALQTKT